MSKVRFGVNWRSGEAKVPVKLRGITLVEPKLTSREIADDLEKRIASGELQPGEALPSERQIRERYQTTKATAAKAIALLLADGLARSEFGRGTYVQDIPKVTRVRRVPPLDSGFAASFADEIRNNGLEPRTEIVHTGTVDPPEGVARCLELSPGDRAIIRKQHAYANERPVQISSSYIPASGAEETGLAEQATAVRGHHTARVKEEIEWRRPTSDEADFLKISQAQHVLEVTCLALDAAGRPLEATVNVFPSQLLRLSYEWSVDDVAEHE